MKPNSILRSWPLAVCLLFLASLSVFAQGTAFTYQGRVLANGTNFTGNGQFKFALVTSSNGSSNATATANLSGAFVTSYTVTSGGSGYLVAPAVSISGGGGSGATATANVSGDVVTSLSPGNAGSGYTSPPTVTIPAPPVNIFYTTYWSNDGTSSAGSEPAAALSVSVANGLFTVVLGDTRLTNMAAMSAALFAQPNLQLRIWFNDGVSGFAVLNPVQDLTPSPYAVFARSASNLLGTLASSQLSGPLPASQLSGTVSLAQLPASLLTNNQSGVNLTGSFTGNGAGLTTLNASQLTSGTVADARLSANVSLLGSSIESGEITDGTIGAADVNAAGFNTTFWRAVGNSGTTPGTHFVGTTDNQPLEFKVNGLRALRLEPNTNSPNVIGGFSGNFVGAGFFGSTIGGGGSLNNSNAIFASYATIAGGLFNNIGTNAGSSAIGGGVNNNIAADSAFATIAGGLLNTIAANTVSATIAGGRFNHIGTNSDYSAIGGGRDNNIAANATYANIAGGLFNDIGTNSDYSAIGGGRDNNIAANAEYATIPGGRNNTATNYAFAAGYNAKATNSGAFVWSDSTGTATGSTASNSVTMRASGGYRFFTGTSTAGAQLLAGATAWSVLSDRNLKKDIQPVNPQLILEKLARVPVAQWHYAWEPDSAPLNLGPMAQDFKAAFFPGREDTSISTLEFDGVALAAIQGLNQKLEEQKTENAGLKERLEVLEKKLSALAEKH